MRSRRKKKEANTKYNLGIYWSFLKNYKLPFSLLLLIILLTEGLRVISNYMFKLLIDKGTLFSEGNLAREAFISFLVWLGIVFLVVYFFKAITPWFRIHLLNRIDSNMMNDLKVRYFNHLIDLDHGFHTSHKTGSLISRLGRGAGGIERMNDVIAFNFAPLLFITIVAGVSLAYFDLMSAIVTVVSLIAFIAYSLYINRIRKPSHAQANTASDIEKANIADMMTNIESIKYFGKENLVKKRTNNLTDKTRRLFIKTWDYFRLLDSGQAVIVSVATFLVIYFPLMRFLDGEITIGTLSFIYLNFTSVLGNVYGFVYGIRGFYSSITDFDDLFQYGKFENAIKDKPGAEELKITKGEIEFKNVTFSYKDRKILNNFSLKIPTNKKIAFVGASGAGKSTIIRLIYRLYDVNSGKILIDGINIKEVKQESLRSELSIVPQECILFDDTIYNNVAFSNPTAGKKEVLQAIKFAQLDKLIKVLPNGDKTIVGERGIKLSGGEKQRVSIARALLADKKVLILDEATSSLDSETEHEIQKDLQRLMEGRTSIIIAHRLSTIMTADIIVVMDKGRISQIGSHEDLIRKEGIYKKLWSLQKGGYID